MSNAQVIMQIVDFLGRFALLFVVMDTYFSVKKLVKRGPPKIQFVEVNGPMEFPPDGDCQCNGCKFLREAEKKKGPQA
jgi:hypothetical protein